MPLDVSALSSSFRSTAASRIAAIAIASCTSTFAISATAFADVPNATCSQAAPFSLTSAVTVPVGQASSDADALAAPCNFVGVFVHSCWYRYDAPQSGTVSLTVNGGNSGLPPVIVVYSNCATESYRDCSISGDCNSCARLTIEVDANVPIFIGVGAQSPTKDSGDAFTLSGTFSSGTCGNDNSCCIEHNTPFCADPTCCSAVCSSDPSCCTTAWDMTCVAIASDLCNNICTNEDCDGNGEPDNQQFGSNPNVAIPLYASTSDPSAWCPPLIPNKKLGISNRRLVSTGMLPEGSFRVIELPYSSNVSVRGLLAIDSRTLVFPNDGGAELNLRSGGLFVGPDSQPGPTTLTFFSVDVSSIGPVTIGSLPLADGAGARAGICTFRSFSSLNADYVSVVDGELRFEDGTTGTAEFLDIAENGALSVGAESTFLYNSGSRIFGRVQLDSGMIYAGQGSLIGRERSLLSGSGIINGNVDWSGVIAPNSQLLIAGDLAFVSVDPKSQATQPADDAKLVLNLATGDEVYVTGSVDLHGTLVINTQGFTPPLGIKIPLMSFSTAISDRFDSVQVRGLAPGIGGFVVRRSSTGNPPSGASNDGLDIVFVPLAQLLQFGDGSQSSLPAVPTDAVRGDFNSDGFDDLAITLTRGDTEAGDVVVFKNTTKGLVQNSIYTVGRDPRGIAAADFDNDTRIDLVVANFIDDTIQVLRNTSVASIDFDQLEQVPIGDGPVDVAVGDFFQDSLLVGTRIDVAVALSEAELFKTVKNVDGNISGSTTSDTASPSGLPTSVGGGDVDNDRDDDVVGGSTGGTTIIPGGSSAASYTGGVIFIPTPNGVTNLQVADMTGDGVPEVLSSLKALAPRPGPPGGPIIYDSLSVLRAEGPGFSSALLDFWLDAQAPTTGDFDADGDLDLALVSRNSTTSPKLTRIIRNDSTPTNTEFNLVAVLPELGQPDVLVAISIDGVGDDILSAEQVTAGDAAGRITLLRTPDPAMPGDLNRDGSINAADLALMFQYWGLPGIGDIDGNGVTNGFDLTVLLSNWGL
ncbi:MAG: FG-GAP-like repeat-containing protein [bacterium]